MSVIQLYSLEKKFNEKKDQYVSLMDSIQYSCLGKEKTSHKCRIAARLNAEMQTYLIQMSNLIVDIPNNKTDVSKKHLELLRISDDLEKDMKELITDEGINIDSAFKENMYKAQAYIWGMLCIGIIGLVSYQYKKNIIV
jgi:hypothetical protein